jgi:GntR family transcriptional regulator, arabinose operon transcriptional repressor
MPDQETGNVPSGAKLRTDAANDRKQPKYRKVKAHLLSRIHTGAFPPGRPLPKERELAATLDVAAGTLRQALQELEADGLIRRVRGQGTFATTADERRSLLRSNLMALILPQVREGLYPSLIHGFEQAVAGAGYQITVGNSCNEPLRQEALIRQAIDNNVAGVALVPTIFPATPPEQVRSLQEHRIPLVFCHRPVEGVTAPLVTWSGDAVGQMVARTLLEQGHRRVATIVAFRDPLVSTTIRAIQETLGEFGLPPLAYCVRYHGERLPGIHAREAIREALRELLQGPDRPTAIHCANLPDAEQVFLLAGEMGLSIPRDLSLIYFGDSRPTGGLAQRLTCVAVDTQSIGFKAGDSLKEMNAGRSSPESELRSEIPLTFLPGETVCPPRQESDVRSSRPRRRRMRGNSEGVFPAK